MRPETLILGVDGGGTKTEAWLASRDEGQDEPRVLGRGKAAGSNPKAIGIPAATRNLDLAIDAAFADSELPRQTVAAICLGLAGADRDQEQFEFRQWAEQHQIARRVLITNDALPVLYAAEPEGVGLALIVGTGSFAIGRNAAGQTVRCGGWGPLFGDEGSGYALALAGLRAAARAADGRGPDTRLLPALLKHFQVDDPAHLISAVYAQGQDRPALAQLAQYVFELAEQSDEVARTILRIARDELADLVITIAEQLDWQQPITLALAGGVLQKQTGFRTELCKAIRAAIPRIGHEVAVEHPVMGDVHIAAAALT